MNVDKVKMFLYKENGDLVISVPEFNIIAWGKTIDKVLKDLKCDLNFLCDTYMKEKDSRLSMEARILKYKLKRLFEKK